MGFRGCSPVQQNPDKIANPIITRPPVEMVMDTGDREINFMTGANKNEGSFVLGSEL